jgi:hypothetical protein
MSEKKFGITKDTKATNTVMMLPPTKLAIADAYFPSGWKFPISNLVNVVFNPEFEKKDGDKVPVLQFIFVDKEKRQYMHTEWTVDSSDTKYNEKLEWQAERIKHIYTAVFGSFPDSTGIGTNAATFAEYFKAVADAFNSVVVDVEGKTTKVYPTVDLFTKLVYYKKNLGFPLTPNFLQRVVKGKVCKLTVKPSESVNPTSGSASPGGLPGMNQEEGDFPEFPSDFA